MLTIEKGLPIPLAQTQPSKFLETLRQLQVGDSFLVRDCGEMAKAKSTVSNYKKREGKGKNFTSRKTREGLRIWRVA